MVVGFVMMWVALGWFALENYVLRKRNRELVESGLMLVKINENMIAISEDLVKELEKHESKGA